MVHVKRIKGNVSQKRLQTLQRKKQQKRQGIISEPLIKHSIEGKWYEYADADRSDDANEADREQLSKVEEKATYLLSRDIDEKVQPLKGNIPGFEATTEGRGIFLVQKLACESTPGIEVNFLFVGYFGCLRQMNNCADFMNWNFSGI
ncbi:unnamed protein product [Anisakis simplex]|uniref:Pre-mRNA-splicing factor SLU7 n=1 Tax=Anisakis simplex TaxID=6269 RepID=A0A0M3J6K0_ANISI|nr:unnamed protein product [Anisakis simplex]